LIRLFVGKSRENTMLLTLVFLALTWFFANKAVAAHKATGEINWMMIVGAGLSLVLAVTAATNQ